MFARTICRNNKPGIKKFLQFNFPYGKKQIVRSFGNNKTKFCFTHDKNNSNTTIGLIIGIIIIGGNILFLNDKNIDQKTNSTNMTTLVEHRIKTTYGYILSGLSITAVSAAGFYKVGFHRVIMRTNPFAYMIISLATSVPLLIGTILVDYHHNKLTKQILWTGFNINMAGLFCIIGSFGGPIITQAILATGCIVGGFSLVVSKIEQKSLQKIETPLGVGLGIVIATGIGNIFFPVPLLYNISLYGGLLIHCGFTMTNTQKLVKSAQNNSKFDPINESFQIYLNTLNIFIRIIQILVKLNINKNINKNIKKNIKK